MRVLILVAAMLASASTAAAFAPVMVTNPFSKLTKVSRRPRAVPPPVTVALGRRRTIAAAAAMVG